MAAAAGSSASAAQAAASGLTATRAPAKAGLPSRSIPPQWSKSRCVRTTVSISDASTPAAVSAPSRSSTAPSHSAARLPEAVSTRSVRPCPRRTSTFEGTESVSGRAPGGARSVPSMGSVPAWIRVAVQPPVEIVSDIERHLALAVSAKRLGDGGGAAHVGQDGALGARGDHRLGDPLDPYPGAPAVAPVVRLDRLQRVDPVRANILSVAEKDHRGRQ